MRANVALGACCWATAAMASPNLAASGRYVCDDGSLAAIDFLASGPELNWRGTNVRMGAVATLWGFKFSGEGVSVRGTGKVGYRKLKISPRGERAVECRSVPLQALAGVATGSVVSRLRMAVPPGATLTVELRDAARMDTAAPLLARTVVVPRGNQMPWWWRLDFDGAKVKPPARPALSARITDKSGKLIWISDTFTPLPVSATDDHAEAEIVVVPVRAAPLPSSK